MEIIWDFLIVIVIVALFISGFFGKIPWSFNVPAIFILLIFWAAGLYNIFIKTRARVREAWADIDVQLKRRYDLIPNLVEAVKGYMAHEKNVLAQVTEARTRAMGAKTLKEHEGAENMLSGALKTLFAVSESYPQLKASENFLELQRELRDTEDKIQAARRFYNGNVRDYNIKVQSFPNSLLAGPFGFKKEEYFKLKEAGEKEPVKVQF